MDWPELLSLEGLSVVSLEGLSVVLLAVLSAVALVLWVHDRCKARAMWLQGLEDELEMPVDMLDAAEDCDILCEKRCGFKVEIADDHWVVVKPLFLQGFACDGMEFRTLTALKRFLAIRKKDWQ